MGSLAEMLAERFKITDRVGVYKAENALSAKDTAREAEQYLRMADLAERYGMAADIANNYLQTVIEAVVKNRKKRRQLSGLKI